MFALQNDFKYEFLEMLNSIFENYNFDGNGIVVDRSSQYPFVVGNTPITPVERKANNKK